jgi:hypothetical protein
MQSNGAYLALEASSEEPRACRSRAATKACKERLCPLPSEKRARRGLSSSEPAWPDAQALPADRRARVKPVRATGPEPQANTQTTVQHAGT